MTREQASIRDLVQFDPIAQARAAGTKIKPIQIPAAFWGTLQPIVEDTNPNPGDPLPHADILIITWTTAETQALSAVFTSHLDYATTWNMYSNNAETYIDQLEEDVISNDGTLGKGAVGWYTITNFNGKKVLLFKSELHPSVDGSSLPAIGLIQQVVKQVNPDLVITTGTAGACGGYLKPGDAVVTDAATFYLVNPKSYPDYPKLVNKSEYTNAVNFNMTYINKCNTSATSLALPAITEVAQKNNYAAPARNPQIFYKNVPGAIKYDAVSANGFTLDDPTDSMGLQQLGTFNEENDAFVAFALNVGLGIPTPSWLSVRNMSEPQAPNLATATKKEWKQMYTNFALYTTYNSAFACWGVICGL